MSSPHSSTNAARLRTLCGAVALVVGLLGMLVLAGWALGSAALTSLAPGLATMKPNTALAFLLAGATLWLLRDPRTAPTATPIIPRLLALAVAVIGLLSLGENLLGWDLGIDELLFRDASRAASTAAPGRMAAASAFNFLLLGLALLFLDTRWSAAADYLAAIAGSVSLVAVIGYTYGIKALYAVTPYATVAVHSALGFLALSIGILIACPERGFSAFLVRGQPGGTLVRQLLLPVVAIPVVIGWLEVEGQRAGLYGTEFGVALAAMLNIIVFFVLVASTSRSVDRGDSERQRIEHTLRATQERLAHVVSSSPAVLYSLRVEGELFLLSWASDNIERLLGHAASEIVGQEWWLEHIHPDDRERVAAQRPILFAEGYVAREYRFLHKDGTYRWIADEQRLLKDASGSPVEVVGSWSDLSQRKRAELKLLQSEEQYKMLFDNNPQSMWVYDTDSWAFLAVNEAALRHYGYSRDEFLGMTIRDIRPLDEVPHLEEEIAQHQQRKSEARFHSPRIWRHRKKDGTLIEVEIAVSSLEFRGRHARLVLATDITERRRLEAQLLQAQKMESVGRLAGGVAHDFNNILGVITGYGELLDKRISHEPPLNRYVKDILKAAERAAGLTRQLLAFSRQQVLQPRNLDLNAVVGELEKMLRRLIGEDIQLVTVLEDQLGLVKADPGQIQQVLMNLAVNARDAMPKGGRLTIETANVELDETYARSRAGVEPGPHIMLAVSDTGHGMDPELLGHIFEPFFTTKDAGKGTGLGLATVHGIVKQSGGHIFVYSEPGQGTTFKVYLPRLRQVEKVAVSSPAPPEAEPGRGSETVLLVEDEESLRSIVKECLEASGYRVVEARHAGHALEIAETLTSPVHLLITDVIMPGMSGSELARELAELHPEMRVLYMSGYTDDAVVLHGVLVADVAFLQKPFTADALARKVREVLDS